MEFYYSKERNVQMLVALLKAHNIKKVVASPGTTNLNFVASLQHDGGFEIYSALDERGAAYIACGLAAESGEPVVITCTGATASRNYFSGLSEAYYKKLPILAVTCTTDISSVGHLVPQFIDRSVQPKDTVKLSVQIQNIKDEEDEWDCNLKLNRALLELRRKGGGPVHVNLYTKMTNDLSVRELPPVRAIRRYGIGDMLPELPENKKIAISAGSHKVWTPELTELVDMFCAQYDAVVFVDHSSGYKGKYKVLGTLAASQEEYNSTIFEIDLLIHIGELSGDYYTYDRLHKVSEVWRVNEDGEVRDTFRRLTKVFEMREEDFFGYYASSKIAANKTNYLKECVSEQEELYRNIPELPFSNAWIAKELAPRLPEGSAIHFGVSNTMRSWTFFELPKTVFSVANVGCRGIDGALSTAIGMSLANPDKVHYCVTGDLTFFYDINSLGNRHINRNLRLLLVNNGRGTEFRLYQHRGQKLLGDNADPYVAAAGHYANKSPDLVRHYAQDLGFKYLTASNKGEFNAVADEFLNPELTDKPMILEVFTDSQDESDAIKMIRNLKVDNNVHAKKMLKQVLGDKGTDFVKKLIKK